MINVILKAVDACGELKTANHKCGLSVSTLTEGWAGLSAASAGIVAKCPNAINHGRPLDTVGQALANAGATQSVRTISQNFNSLAAGQGGMVNLQGGASFGQCIVNVKATMKS